MRGWRSSGVALLGLTALLVLLLLAGACASRRASPGCIAWTEITPVEQVGAKATGDDPRSMTSEFTIIDLPGGKARRIFDAAGVHFLAAVSDEWAVWVDWNAMEGDPATPGGQGNASDLRALNLTSGEERPVCTVKRDQLMPALSANWVVWQDSRNDTSSGANSDIYAYDLASGTERAVCTATGNQEKPAISGDWVVWADFRRAERDPYEDSHTNGDIYAYNLSTEETRAICTAPNLQWDPAISGDWIVWEDHRRGDNLWDVRAYNLASGEEKAVRLTVGQGSTPAISGQWVVCADERRGQGNDDIFAYNIASGEERAIATGAGDQSNPRISGEWIVWEDFRDSRHSQVVAFDLSSDEERVVTSSDGTSLGYAVWAEPAE